MNIQDGIEKATGISKRDQDEIWKQVRDNHSKLDSCSRHDFSICLERHSKKPVENPTPGQIFGAYWQCTKCGGYVDGIARSWYEKGIKHSKS